MASASDSVCVAVRFRMCLTRARKALGWPKRCKLAHAFLWEYSYKIYKLAQLLSQLGVFLTEGAVLSFSLAPSSFIEIPYRCRK